MDKDITVKAGDELYSIFESIIDNAIRYNNSKDPKVEIYTRNRDKYIEICIKDNGPGIPRDERNIVNKNTKISKLHHSSGLVLWLAKWLIEKYRGEITIDDDEYCGSTVKLKLLKYNF